jgi:hypothetical protein
MQPRTDLGTRPCSRKHGFVVNTRHASSADVNFNAKHKSAALVVLVSNTTLKDNDPSAGSPTETLLRLLLPLNDQV